MTATEMIGRGRGGKRPGAGRPKGSLKKPRRELMTAAREYSEEALGVLVGLMNGKHFVYERNEETGRKIKKPLPVSDSVRMRAAQSILDRAYGRPRQAVEDEDEPVDLSLLNNEELNEMYRLTCKLHGVEPEEFLDGAASPGGDGSVQ